MSGVFGQPQRKNRNHQFLVGVLATIVTVRFGGSSTTAGIRFGQGFATRWGLRLLEIIGGD